LIIDKKIVHIDATQLVFQLVDKFCYLSNMLSVAGAADTAVEASIQIGWNIKSDRPLSRVTLNAP